MRIALASLLAAGLAGLALLPEPGSLGVALLVAALAFLLAGAKGAVDLIDLNPADLAADAVAFAVLGTALALTTAGNALLIGTLLALAFAAQGLPRAVRMARCPRRSTSPPMPPGSA